MGKMAEELVETIAEESGEGMSKKTGVEVGVEMGQAGGGELTTEDDQRR